MKAVKTILPIVLLVAALALFISFLSRPKLGSEFTEEVNTLDGVWMEISGEVTNRRAAIRVYNETDTVYISDILFSVQVEKDGKWYSLVNRYKGENVADALVHNHWNSGRNELVCEWDHMYGTLPKGHYRVFKVLYEEETRFQGEPYYLAAEFTIK